MYIYIYIYLFSFNHIYIYIYVCILYICIYQIYVKNIIYRPHLAKTINLRQFRMENDRKNGAVLTIILPARFKKQINSKKSRHFFRAFFFQKCFPSNTFHFLLRPRQRPLPLIYIYILYIYYI